MTSYNECLNIIGQIIPIVDNLDLKSYSVQSKCQEDKQQVISDTIYDDLVTAKTLLDNVLATLRKEDEVQFIYFE